MRGFMGRYKGIKFLTCYAVLCALCVVALGVNSDKASEETKLEQRMQMRVSIDVKDVSIKTIIETLTGQAGADHYISPKVEDEKLSFKITDVPLEEALRTILEGSDCDYIAGENIIRILPASQIPQVTERLETEIFEIKYSDITEVVKALKEFSKGPGATVSSIQGSSHIIVTDTEPQMREIKKFIETIDRMTPQVLVEARIYDITSNETFDLGVNWHIGRNTPITEITNTNTNTNTNTITDVGATGPTTTTVQTVTDTDGTVVDKTVATTTSGTAGRTGDTTTDGTTDTTTKTTAGTWLNDSFRKSKPFMGGSFDKVDGGTVRFGFLNDVVDIELALNILEAQIGAKLLANPRILVLDNQTAIIKIITEIPYQQLQQGQGAGDSFGTTAFKEVGVTLEVTPHIASGDKMIRLHLLPKFSVKTGEVNVGDPGAQIRYPQPVIDSREVETTLLVKNGETVVLGGLRKREVNENIQKIPLLGDIPLIKGLFRSESEETVTSELIVFVTPWIIEQPVLSSDMTDVEQQAYEETKFDGPVPIKTRAEKEESREE